MSPFDPRDPDFVADPYPALAAARSEGPVLWHEGLGMYVTTTHAAANEVLRTRALGRVYRPKSRPAAAEDDEWTVFDWLHADSILDSEPPKHTRIRRLVAGAFGRGHVERMRPRIEAIAARLLDDVAVELADTGRADVLAPFAEPLPVLVICELLGAPQSDWKTLRDWSQAIVKMYEIGPSPQVQADAQAAAREFASYVTQLADERQKNPGEDLLTSLVQERDGGDRLSPRELIANVVLLLNAGHEASVNGFGNGLHSLLSAPEQVHSVVGRLDEPPVIERLVEEMLRHDSPSQLFDRTATADVVVQGVPIAEGQKVAALLGAANRDPAVFTDPDVFDAARDPNPHLAFGVGIHFCIGAPLARLELGISTRALLGRFGPLQVVEAQRRNTFVLKGFDRIVVAPAPQSK